MLSVKQIKTGSNVSKAVNTCIKHQNLLIALLQNLKEKAS